MSVDSAFERLREANPVPRPRTLQQTHRPGELLGPALERSAEMKTHPRTNTEIPARNPRRNWRAALAMGAALILVGAAITLSNDDRSQVVAGQGTLFEVLEERGEFEIFLSLVT